MHTVIRVSFANLVCVTAQANVRQYYQQFEEQQTQSLIDQRIKEHLGQTAAYGQVGAAYNQHLMARPRLPVLPTPMMGQMPGGQPMAPGIRIPVLPRPMGAPGNVDCLFLWLLLSYQCKHFGYLSEHAVFTGSTFF